MVYHHSPFLGDKNLAAFLPAVKIVKRVINENESMYDLVHNEYKKRLNV